MEDARGARGPPFARTGGRQTSTDWIGEGAPEGPGVTGAPAAEEFPLELYDRNWFSRH